MSKRIALLAIALSALLAVAPTASAHVLGKGTAEQQAQRFIRVLKNQIGGKRPSVDSCRRTSRHRFICRVSLTRNGRRCSDPLAVFYTSHRDRQPNLRLRGTRIALCGYEP
jgi:hypothetical protein